MFEFLKGQFALAVLDRKRRCIVLARDRFGICPLYFSIQGDWLLFGSEIKALLASGMVQAKADLRGIDQAFNFFSVPGPATSLPFSRCPVISLTAQPQPNTLKASVYSPN